MPIPLRPLAWSLALSPFAAAAAAPPTTQPLTEIPFTQVHLHDQFWSPRLETNRTVTIPHCFKMCETTGRIDNFAKAAGLLPGDFRGIYFDDSDVYKAIEGASYSLATHPDPALDSYLDALISKIAAAQRPDGYLNTYYTLKGGLDNRYTKLSQMHELYCAGHLFEAAVAHHRATGKTSLLTVATKFADQIATVFGPDKRHDVPGHEEIELALIKLSAETHNPKYHALAQFFISCRGNPDGRPKLYGPYHQDHTPVTDQTTPTGHAVRQMYLLCAETDLAPNNPAYVPTLDQMWDNLINKRMYLTGGIGSRHTGEAFGDDYELPNDTAYAETCAAIGNALWQHRMNLLHADAKYADTLEQVLYNGLLSGVSLSGDRFFYVNPLASNGHHHRQEWYGTACCPVNVLRFLPSLPGYFYATDTTTDTIYVNLYATSESTLTLPALSPSPGTPGEGRGEGSAPRPRQTSDAPSTARAAGVSPASSPPSPRGENGDAASFPPSTPDPLTLHLAQETRYPWDGLIALIPRPNHPNPTFTLALRIPSWCPNPEITINDKPTPFTLSHGYAELHRSWGPADVVKLQLHPTPRRIHADPRVTADTNRVAIQYGPLVYCAESADQPTTHLSSLYLPPTADITEEAHPDLLGGITTLHTTALSLSADSKDPKPTPLTLIPYYAWDHRTPGDMQVWLAEDPSAAKPAPLPTPANTAHATASHTNPTDTLDALSDALPIKDSSDQSIPRFTWWPHRGTPEYVQYDFPTPTTISCSEVYFFDDTPTNGHCRPPASWRLLYKDGDHWTPIPATFPTTTNQFNTITFPTPITTTSLRLEAQLQPTESAGLLEWRVK